MYKKNKDEFFKLMYAWDRFHSHIVFSWFDIRQDQGLPWQYEKGQFKFDWAWEDGEPFIIITTNFGVEKFPATDFYKEVPKEEEPQMLWHSNYWDGPLSGIARYKGQLYWFDCVKMEGEDDDNIFDLREYALYELSEKEIAYEIDRHNKFRRNVGRHCDYCDDFLDEKNTTKTYTQRMQDAYYRWQRMFDRRDEYRYRKNKCIGTFNDYQFWRERPRNLKLLNGVENEE